MSYYTSSHRPTPMRASSGPPPPMPDTPRLRPVPLPDVDDKTFYPLARFTRVEVNQLDRAAATLELACPLHHRLAHSTRVEVNQLDRAAATLEPACPLHHRLTRSTRVEMNQLDRAAATLELACPLHHPLVLVTTSAVARRRRLSHYQLLLPPTTRVRVAAHHKRPEPSHPRRVTNIEHMTHERTYTELSASQDACYLLLPRTSGASNVGIPQIPFRHVRITTKAPCFYIPFRHVRAQPPLQVAERINMIAERRPHQQLLSDCDSRWWVGACGNESPRLRSWVAETTTGQDRTWNRAEGARMFRLSKDAEWWGAR
ncbi:hypothetical protein BU17DRAFT_67874 [Hysterangium stoloniferum]|nr:hypothetical protein BU17DRAFT_67874 [Hysterangium stoloniferum]